jgi:hypothetical protein
LQPRPIESFNRADSFSECTLKPSCVKIRTYHSGTLAKTEVANDADGLMLLIWGIHIKFNISSAVSVVAMLNVRASGVADLRESDELHVEPSVGVRASSTVSEIDAADSLCHRPCCG